MSPSGLQHTPGPVRSLKSTNCRNRVLPPAKDRGPRGPAERQGPFETAPGSHARLPDSLEAMTRPARGVSGQSSTAGPWPTVCPPPTRHLTARDLREILALIRTLLDARSLVATASAARHGGPTVRHGGIQHTRAWFGIGMLLVLGVAQDHPSTSVRTRRSRWRRPDLLRPAARWYVPHPPGTRQATGNTQSTRCHIAAPVHPFLNHWPWENPAC